MADIGDDAVEEGATSPTYDVEEGANSPTHVNFEEEQREQPGETQQQM